MVFNGIKLTKPYTYEEMIAEGGLFTTDYGSSLIIKKTWDPDNTVKLWVGQDGVETMDDNWPNEGPFYKVQGEYTVTFDSN